MKTSTGDYSTGYRSTGDRSTGDRSTGNYSTGYRSTGDRSTGNWSTGDYSTGYRSTGDRSTGYRSTGNWSTGNWSTGNWSISHYSTGYFSTIDYSGLSLFNHPITKQELDTISFPDFLYFDLTQWIEEKDMTDTEKQKNPTYTTTGGFLKVYDYKEAFQKAYREAPKEQIEQLKNLPHFDAEVFYQISGIKVDEVETIEIGGVKYDKKEVENRLKDIKPL